MRDFEKYAISQGISSNRLNEYGKYVIKNGMVSPTILEERSLNVVGFDIFSRLQVDRILFLGSEINDDVANIINAQLLYLNSIGDEDVKMFINSPGGSVIDGLSIYDTMNFITPDVSTYCMGMCASMGSILLSSGTRGKRYCMPHGEIMLHQPMSGTGPGTQESDFAIAYEQLKKCKNTLYEILSQNTGKTIEEITLDADRDHWLSAEESLPNVYGCYGLIDKIVTKNKK